MLVTQSDSKRVRTGELSRRKLIVFLQAGTGGSTRLPVKETSFRGFEKQAIRIVALCGDVGVKTLVAELRRQ